jgi:antitoxin ParD1/3/4
MDNANDGIRFDKDCQSLSKNDIGGVDMATMNVSLPDPMKDWVESQVKTGRYANASDYVRDLIRQDQDSRQALIDALEEGAASGVSPRTIDEIWQSAMAKAAHG